MWDTIDTIMRVVSSVAATGAVIMGIVNSRRIKNVRVSINGRMDQLLEQAKLYARSQGAADEKARVKTDDNHFVDKFKI
jgi:hypothetical protein